MSAKKNILWYQNAVFYELYVRAFRDSNGDGHGDLVGVIEKLDYLKELGVDCIWLLPLYPSPLKDDGYDISDYYGIHSDYGTVEDFDRLITEAHKRGLRVITDLVVNHTSDQHPWFVESRASRQSPKRDWYVWSDTDQLYQDARIIFLDTEDSNWAYDEKTQQYYWHRFYSSQPDLNYDNPEVAQAMLGVMRYWLDKGIDGFRVDAVPYLFERDGTDCENLPETHAYVKEMRRFVEANWPEAIMLAEANQWPEDVRAYFGDGDEFHMAFHFPVMPRIFISLHLENAQVIRDVMARTPAIPSGCQWCTFLRNHDELTLEMVTPEEREMMWSVYAPDDRMRLNLGIRRRLAPLLGNDLRKIVLANNIMFSLQGAPVLYYGDEIGMGDNIDLPDRNGVRTPMQWREGANVGFSEAPADKLYAPVIDSPEYGHKRVNVAEQRVNAGSLFNRMKELIALRKRYQSFFSGSQEFIEVAHPEVLAVVHCCDKGELAIFHNLSGSDVSFSLHHPPMQGAALTEVSCKDGRLSNPGQPTSAQVELDPYGSLWLLRDNSL
ncbi:MAG: maltose alpha-D-glucosyltransferase [Anaerolineae bacterium]|nr:maltose alpha-D-glucosyltransferase [Anaerolineae bacterium]